MRRIVFFFWTQGIQAKEGKTACSFPALSVVNDVVILQLSVFSETFRVQTVVCHSLGTFTFENMVLA